MRRGFDGGLRKHAWMIFTKVQLLAGGLVLAILISGESHAQDQTFDSLYHQVEHLREAGLNDSALVIARKASQLASQYRAVDSSFLACYLRMSYSSRLADFLEDYGYFRESEALRVQALANEENLADSILGESETGDHSGMKARVAEKLEDLASLYIIQGRLAEAQVSSRRALEILQQRFEPNSGFIADALSMLGKVYCLQGRYNEAEPILRRVLYIEENTLPRDSSRICSALNSLADLYDSQHRNEEAESCYRRALAMLEAGTQQNDMQMAIILNNLAYHYYRTHRDAEAESIYLRALAIEQEIARGQNDPGVATELNNLAQLYDDQGRYDEADSLHQQALEILQRAFGPDHPKVASTKLGYAWHYRATDRAALAVKLTGEAAESRLRCFESNVAVLPEKDALQIAEDVQRARDYFLSAVTDIGLEDSLRTELANIVLRCKGMVTEAMIWRQESLVNSHDSATQKLYESWRLAQFQVSKLFMQGSNEEYFETYRLKLDSLSHLADSLESELSLVSTSFRKESALDSVSVSHLIDSLLPDGAVLIEYMRWKYRWAESHDVTSWYSALLLSKGRAPKFVYLGAAYVIDEVVSRYRRHFEQLDSLIEHKQKKAPDEADSTAYWQIARELDSLVVEPLAEYLHKDSLVLIAPDGELNTVAFAGLIDEHGQYMIQRYPLHYLSAGRDLIRYDTAIQSNSGLLALGGADFDASASKRLAALRERPVDLTVSPTDSSTQRTQVVMAEGRRSACDSVPHVDYDEYSKDEVMYAQAGWQRNSREVARVLTDAEASEEQLKKLAGSSRVLHISTHGFYLSNTCGPDPLVRTFVGAPRAVGENPLLHSGFLLAGANLRGQGADSTGGDDGIVTALEVSGLDLTGTELVVLSACESGLGKLNQGEGVYGLRRAFELARARQVLSSLWKVPSITTGKMLGQLYANNSEPLYLRLRDLQLLQIKELRQNVPRVEHPWYWGAWVLSGALE